MKAWLKMTFSLRLISIAPFFGFPSTALAKEGIATSLSQTSHSTKTPEEARTFVGSQPRDLLLYGGRRAVFVVKLPLKISSRCVLFIYLFADGISYTD